MFQHRIEALPTSFVIFSLLNGLNIKQETLGATQQDLTVLSIPNLDHIRAADIHELLLYELRIFRSDAHLRCIVQCT